MKEDKKEKLLDILGWTLILVGISVIMFSILSGEIWMVLWMCYITAFIAGIGILKRNSKLVVSQFSIIAIILLIWNLDFFYYLIFGKALIITQPYFFNFNSSFALINLYHILALPIFIMSLYLMKIKEYNFWMISIPQVIFLYVATRLLTPPEYNVNCIMQSCLSTNFGNLYPLVWFSLFPISIYLTSYFLKKIRMFKK